MFKKILIANRGEIAKRIMITCEKLGIKTVCIYSEADQDAGYLRSAYETVCVGGAGASESYLNQDAILKAAADTECEALHPGYGFLAENALFATRCLQQKLIFIGPKPHSIRQMGDKATARSVMRHAGLMPLPGSAGIVLSAQEALEEAKNIGYPLLLKASAGGGGKGMRLVESADKMEPMFEEATREAIGSFSIGDLYIEKYVRGGRHIEFQILADAYGTVVHLGERECSIQRNRQKLLEEAPSNGISEAQRASIGKKICAALSQIGYENAGTIEFLMDSTGQLFFMEMNTRIQVEHPVTEMITGVDLVACQIKIAANESLAFAQKDIQFRGHAIEVRINAEDPQKDFRPSPGKISSLEWPKSTSGEHVRVDTHLENGDVISPFYDSMVAKIIVHGDTREASIKSMEKALQGTSIEGITTTLSLHKAIVAHSSFQAGDYNCDFMQLHEKELNRG